MAAPTIYLDHNATSPLLPAAAEAMQAAWRTAYANPASQHAAGRSARRLLASARERTLALLGAEAEGLSPDRLVFTSGGTEANTLALRGLLGASGKRRLIVSAIEHPSVAQTADQLRREGYQVERLGVDSRGAVEVEQLRQLLADAPGATGLVSVMLASNETAVVQPIAPIAAVCREAGVLLHTDAVQAVGKMSVNFRELGVAALTFTAHKFHGPAGIGGLVLTPGASLSPQMFGGFQQEGLRPGTESAPLAAGLLAALQAAHDEAQGRQTRMRQLRDRLEAALLRSWPGAERIGGEAQRLPHATCLAFPGTERQALVMAYDLAGVACSTGSACASGSSEPSPTLVAMGLDDRLVSSAVRFGVGALTTDGEIDDAIERLQKVHARLLAG